MANKILCQTKQLFFHTHPPTNSHTHISIHIYNKYINTYVLVKSKVNSINTYLYIFGSFWTKQIEQETTPTNTNAMMLIMMMWSIMMMMMMIKIYLF